MAVHTRLALLRTLRHLHTNGPVLPEYGVLWNVRHLTNKDSAIENRLQQQLRQYYGQEYSPLHATAYDCIPKDPTGWENPSRRTLLNWLIHTLETEQQQNG